MLIAFIVGEILSSAFEVNYMQTSETALTDCFFPSSSI